MKFSGNYPDEWTEISLQVREGASWRCIRCGHRHETSTERKPCDEGCDPTRHTCGRLNDGKQRMLTVHHLDGDKSHNVWWNLLPLCQVCHLVIQAKVNPFRPWLMLEHSEWFKPYVAGFYGWRYLHEDITREQAESRMDELLALEVIG